MMSAQGGIKTCSLFVLASRTGLSVMTMFVCLSVAMLPVSLLATRVARTKQPLATIDVRGCGRVHCGH